MNYSVTNETYKKIDQKINELVDVSIQQNILAKNMSDHMIEDNYILDDISNHMDETQKQIDKATSTVIELQATKAHIFAWILMIILIIAIVCVWCFVNGRKI